MGINKEQKLQNYLRKLDEPLKIGSRGFVHIIDFEKSIHSAVHVLSRSSGGSFGRIDLLFRRRNQGYCCEIKYTDNKNQFFDALKVLGYTSYYNWEYDASFKPAIMMPMKHIKFEHQIMSAKSGILLIGFKKDGDGYKFKEVGDKPLFKTDNNW